MTLSTSDGYGDVGLGPGHLPVGGTVELRCRSTVDMDQVEMGQGLQGQALGLGSGSELSEDSEVYVATVWEGRWTR